MIAIEKGRDFLAEAKRQLNRAEQRFLKLNMLKIKIERYDNEKELNSNLFSFNNSEFIVNQLKSDIEKNDLLVSYNKQMELISKNISISLLYLIEIFYSFSSNSIEKDLNLRSESKDVFYRIIQFIDRDELRQKLDLKITIPRIIQFEFYLAGKEFKENSFDNLIANRIERIKRRVFR